MRLTDETSLRACSADVGPNPIRCRGQRWQKRSKYAITLRCNEGSRGWVVNLRSPGGREAMLKAAVGRLTTGGAVGRQSVVMGFCRPCQLTSSPFWLGRVRVNPPGAAATTKFWRCRSRIAWNCWIGRRGRTSASVRPILVRLSLDTATWYALVRDFGRLFCSVAGHPEYVDSMRSRGAHRRDHRRLACELLTVNDERI